MKKLILCFSLIFLFLYSISANPSFAEQKFDTYLVTFKNEVDSKIILNYGGTIEKTYKYTPTIVSKIPVDSIDSLKENPNISTIEKDVSVEVIPDIKKEYLKKHSNIMYTGAPVLSNWNMERVKVFSVHKQGYKGANIKIGIIDSGIDITHEDLKVTDGINIIDPNSNYNDDYGHGTRVAGVISALDNNKGVLGMAPLSEIFAIKVLDARGKGSISNVISGIEWAIDNKLDIVNLSLQTIINNNALEEVVKKAYEQGIILVAAAGNKGHNGVQETITYPAAYKEVISVGAIDENNEKVIFSSVGSRLDLVAPGDNVYTTIPRSFYYVYSGTSIASPHVAGIAALLKESNPNLTNIEISQILKDTATDLGDNFYYGNGLVNAEKALLKSKKMRDNEKNG
ncbi:S8 family peptidase [Bacillus thuringiensis]|uniref:S8 family peptidase n=1 Tax=Bacillus thuringiensis TaxID=1428 RepID=UPI001EDFBF09|nr:S8 family peptidase [Bacillus thuringiensis]MCG3426186.1 S8 family peptidase [Bacillus thuringiensis]